MLISKRLFPLRLGLRFLCHTHQSGAFNSSAGVPAGGFGAAVCVADHIVWLAIPRAAVHYPDRLRRVSYRDPEDGGASLPD